MTIVRLAGMAISAVTAINFATAANAADIRMPTKARPLPVAAAPAWTGCYLGGHTGLAAGHTSWTDNVANGAIDATFAGRTANTDMSGGVYGAQIGCDYQASGNFVLGIQGDYSGSTLSGTNQDQFNSTWTLRSKVDWMASITGRVGIAASNSLVYVKGGWAWQRNTLEVENTGIFNGAPSTTRGGWVIGGGVEWMFAPSWTVFMEGNYYTFGSSTSAFLGDPVNPTPAFVVKASQNMEVLRLGVNYRFGGDLGLASSRY